MEPLPQPQSRFMTYCLRKNDTDFVASEANHMAHRHHHHRQLVFPLVFLRIFIRFWQMPIRSEICQSHIHHTEHHTLSISLWLAPCIPNPSSIL